jgi:gamma-glutamylcyclotransferase (GGCT)/AIG2-like uncharacterized protein YtfP
MHLLAYGTLMCPEILTAVTGLTRSGVPASLSGYARWRLRGAAYPAIVPDPAARVAGLLYPDLPDRAWVCLDHFEGECYRRLAVPAELAGGEPVPAQVYVLQPAFAHRLDYRPWDFAGFLRHGKAGFLSGYSGFDAL